MQYSFPISLMALAMGLVLSAVAGFFSVVGLGLIFAGAYWSVVVMAGTLEVSKIVAASWIYRNWSIAPWIMRMYMTIAVIVLVFITSMGIFGYLSKAHVDQVIQAGGNNEIQIEALERRIARQQSIISDSETVLLQLDRSVQTLIDYDRIRGPNGSIAVRASQKEERQSLNDSISDAYEEIETLNDELFPLKKTQIELEAEIGPLKYIAELVYGDEASNYFDTAVRWIIILLVLVFDPLAICLLLAGNAGIQQREYDEPIAFLTEEDVMRNVELEEVRMSREGHGRDGN